MRRDVTISQQDPALIVRLAARGEGVAADGRHFPGAVPGDHVEVTGGPGGNLGVGPHHVTPPCRHFGTCGGCQLQHCDDQVLADFVRSRIVNAAAKQDFAPQLVTAAHLSPPRNRRRANLHAINGGGRPVIGFRQGNSHKLIDLRECPVMAPELFALIAPLRAMLADRKGRYAIDIGMTLTDQGTDLALKNLTVEGLEQTEALLDFAREQGLARVSIDQGYGSETVWEPDLVTVTLSGVRVHYPAGAFLQATADGEAALIEAAQEWLGDATSVADLFSGLGTFAFALAGTTKVLAVEAARDAHLACKSAAAISQKPVHSLHRDLFRNPLRVEELDKFAAVLLDPPRAGARDQIAQIAQSKLSRAVYISCNPSSWSRDARQLLDAGFALQEVRPVGQFRWSTHVELASLFTR